MSSLFPNYARRPVHLIEGKGTIVKDEQGKSYLDFTSGIAVLSLGHAHPAIVKALQEQSEKLWHTSNLFESPKQEQLANILIEETHFAHAFSVTVEQRQMKQRSSLRVSIQASTSSLPLKIPSTVERLEQCPLLVRKRYVKDLARCWKPSVLFPLMM